MSTSRRDAPPRSNPSFALSRSTDQIEGLVSWDGPDEPGLEAAALGAGTFVYDVRVILDGVEHTATAVWPNDQIDGNEPSVALNFQPPLPALNS